jgi:hypothetical protein
MQYLPRSIRLLFLCIIFVCKEFLAFIPSLRKENRPLRTPCHSLCVRVRACQTICVPLKLYTGGEVGKGTHHLFLLIFLAHMVTAKTGPAKERKQEHFWVGEVWQRNRSNTKPNYPLNFKTINFDSVHGSPPFIFRTS